MPTPVALHLHRRREYFVVVRFRDLADQAGRVQILGEGGHIPVSRRLRQLTTGGRVESAEDRDRRHDGSGTGRWARSADRLLLLRLLVSWGFIAFIQPTLPSTLTINREEFQQEGSQPSWRPATTPKPRQSAIDIDAFPAGRGDLPVIQLRRHCENHFLATLQPICACSNKSRTHIRHPIIQ